jgi:hypothetical protein
VERGTSVTVFVSLAGRTTLFFTHESGRVPGECLCEEHERRCVASVGSGMVPLAHAVVQVEGALSALHRLWSEVLVSRLCGAAVDCMEMLFSGTVMVDDIVVRCVVLLEQGLCSCVGAECLCTAVSVCAACGALAPEQMLFVCATVYMGSEPYGNGHWWCGATDATRFVSEGEVWLCCPSVWSRLALIHSLLWSEGDAVRQGPAPLPYTVML